MTGGIDTGPCLSYGRLSFRRLFIRPLWTGAFRLPALVLFQLGGLTPVTLQVFGLLDPDAMPAATSA
jgi:hypothetical protein